MRDPRISRSSSTARKIPIGVAMNVSASSHSKLWETAGQKNGYFVNSFT